MLDQIRIVLVNTSHTGNMGSAARAMKTMGLTQLVLVDPQAQPDEEAVALAAGASDILARARIVPTLDEAIADCGLVIGTSARSRTLSWPMLDPREAGEKLVAEGMAHPVALVFGRERTGLTNDELQKCHFHVAIPANPEYSVDAVFDSVSIWSARWVSCDDKKKLAEFERANAMNLSTDAGGNMAYLAPNRVNLSLTQERWPDIVFHETRELNNALND